VYRTSSKKGKVIRDAIVETVWPSSSYVLQNGSIGANDAKSLANKTRKRPCVHRLVVVVFAKVLVQLATQK
jgi:hypothetical protein